MDRDPLFELAVYLVSSARLSLEEPVVYGSFRLVEAILRVIDTDAVLNGEAADGFLQERRAEIDTEKLRMIEDHEGYRAWLDSLLREFAAETKRRSVAA